jgi:NADH dehydrogenase
VSRDNFLLYSPLLPGASAGTLEPRHVVVPLREELDWTDVRLGEVTSADPGVNEVGYRSADGDEITLRYDQLIVALGSVSRVLPVEGLAEHGLGYKTISDAIALRNRAVNNLEVAESLDDPEERAAWLTFVFVGAGYAGVEGIAEMQDFVSDVIERYPRCRLDSTRWILVEAQDRIMPEIPPSLAEFATSELKARGIEVRTGTMLDSCSAGACRLSTGEDIGSRTLVWTAGVKPVKVVQSLGLPLGQGGRIDVDETLRVKGQENVWAIGDSAGVPDPAAGGERPCPPTAQHALRQGRLAAENVADALGGRPPKRFKYKTLGVFVDMGRHQAVATMLGVRLRGFPAWFAARTYHLLAMPGMGRRVRLMADWTVGLFFGRDSTELGTLGHPVPLGEHLEDEAPR